MKNTKLIIALALALGLAACGNQPKSNENTEPAPATVTETPFDWGMLKLGMEIPKTIEGCTIEPVTYMAEGEQQVEYAIKKDGKTLAILEPEFDVDLMELTNKVGVIAIHSEEYQTDKGFHVGSNINDIFAAYPDMLTTGYAPDGNLYVDLGGTQFVVSGEDYAGTLPELSCDEGELIAEPTFKPDAKVKVVRLYKWDF